VAPLPSSCRAISAAGGDAGGNQHARLVAARHLVGCAPLSDRGSLDIAGFQFGWLDFGARPLNSALALTGALLTQILCSRLYGLPSIDLRSPLITRPVAEPAAARR